ncbi:alpha/beta fold hydrolase [Desulfovibrio sp. OttesenSCG-928-G15]|nr:alpha/beta fold hydrolase [Desulfovibrio sp. OttesenSCG-928-G15]
MPLVPSTYKAPLWLRGGHCQTIFPSLFRKVPPVVASRAIIPATDGDEIVCDTFLAAPPRRSDSVVVLSHGLEGNSLRKYMRGMMLRFAQDGWDSVGRNFRGCGGEMNRTVGLYHSGQTEDLHSVIEHCLYLGYERITLVGFSMGANQVLKYLGEHADKVPGAVVAAVAFSAPCDLAAAAQELDKPENALYMRSFLRTLTQKVKVKHESFPDAYPLDGLESIRTFAEFDNRYTGPIHGFSSARDYWEKAACLPFLTAIRTPVLLINALNDPFLAPSCSPVDIAASHACLHLETPQNGGHVGFTSPFGQDAYWSEDRAAEFVATVCAGRAGRIQ